MADSVTRFAWEWDHGARDTETMTIACTVEVQVHRLHCDPEWREVSSHGSIREARRWLPWSIDRAVDRLSHASYDIRIVRLDGSVKAVGESAQDHAIRRCKAEQRHNSIGERMSRGETVAV